jgi:small-conductance mechanosensitive channel
MNKIIDLVKANSGVAEGIIWFLKLCLVLVAWRFIKIWLEKITGKLQENERGKVAAPIVKVCVPVVCAAYGIVFLFSSGVQGGLQALITGSGVMAIVVGVACQDTIGNFVSGLVLLLTRPFTVGDVIRYVDSDITGTVENVTFRHTIIRTFENKRLVIPNSQLSKAVLENYTSEDASLCLMLDFSVNYGQNLNNALTLLKNTVSVIDGVISCQLHIESLSYTAVILRLRAVLPGISEQIRLKHEILFAVYNAFNEFEIEFAYPHITIDGKLQNIN